MFSSGRLVWRDGVAKSALIAVAAALLLLGGTSLATAKNRNATGAHGNHYGLKGDQTSRTKGRASPSPQRFGPDINETTSRPTAANPYYRLSDRYYDYSDPYHALFNFYAVPPQIPGYTYGHVRMPRR
jgi:hypothetical protein